MKNKIKKKIKYIIFFIFIVFIIYGFNSRLVTREFIYKSSKLPDGFNGFKIVFISDFHGKKFGEKEQDLIDSIIKCDPDIVVFTGDMIDDKEDCLINIKYLLDGISGKYDVYAISGNHEDDVLSYYNKLLNIYDEYDVKFLDETWDVIEKDGDKIGIYGKSYRGGYFDSDFLEAPDKEIADFNILLYHDATSFPTISDIGYDIVLSGHTHGGIIRLPFIGGLINNDGSMFTDYDNGYYEMNGTVLYSSRGLGEAFVPRFLNNRDLICITLEK